MKHTRIIYLLKEFYNNFDIIKINNICSKYWQVDLIKEYIKATENNNENRDLLFVSILKKFEKVIVKNTNNKYNVVNNNYLQDFFSNLLFELDSRIINYYWIWRKDRKTTQSMLKEDKRVNVYDMIKKVIYIAHYKTILEYDEGIRKIDIQKSNVKTRTFYWIIKDNDENEINLCDLVDSWENIPEEYYETYIYNLFENYLESKWDYKLLDLLYNWRYKYLSSYIEDFKKEFYFITYNNMENIQIPEQFKKEFNYNYFVSLFKQDKEQALFYQSLFEKTPKKTEPPMKRVEEIKKEEEKLKENNWNKENKKQLLLMKEIMEKMKLLEEKNKKLENENKELKTSKNTDTKKKVVKKTNKKTNKKTTKKKK